MARERRGKYEGEVRKRKIKARERRRKVDREFQGKDNGKPRERKKERRGNAERTPRGTYEGKATERRGSGCSKQKIDARVSYGRGGGGSGSGSDGIGGSRRAVAAEKNSRYVKHSLSHEVFAKPDGLQPPPRKV